MGKFHLSPVMTPLEIDLAARDLRRRSRRVAEYAALTLAAAVAATFALTFSTHVTIALGSGALVEALLLLDMEYRRRDLISRLALEDAAYVLPEVARYGLRSTQREELNRLSAWLSALPAEARLPGNIYVQERVESFARELEVIASDLCARDVVVDPTSAVACRRLLTRAVESPLYNARVPADELRTVLERIRRGISR